MTLPSSGPLSLSDIRGEFGGPTPIALENYYRGGSYVPNITQNSAVPTSGAIGIESFYNTTHAFIFTQTVSSSVNQYNLSSQATSAGWNGSTPIIATVSINNGVWCYSNDTGTPGFYVPSLPSGSIVVVNNYGYITGAGGAGGTGGDYGFGACSGTVGANGGSGGTGLVCTYTSTINNYSGFIAGGGGGGGGGGSAQYVFYNQNSDPGGGGGGGAGGLNGGGSGGGVGCFVYTIVNGTPYPSAGGTNGSNGSGGSGGAGGSGGHDIVGGGSSGGSGGTGGGWGSNGSSGSAGTGGNGQFAGGSGGSAGAAITGSYTYNALGGSIYGSH